MGITKRKGKGGKGNWIEKRIKKWKGEELLYPVEVFGFSGEFSIPSD